jgi:hypothetical protein
MLTRHQSLKFFIADTIVCDSTTIEIDVTDLLGGVLGDKVFSL